MEEMRAREKDDDGNEMHWRWRRIDEKIERWGKEEQDDLLSWTRLDDERC